MPEWKKGKDDESGKEYLEQTVPLSSAPRVGADAIGRTCAVCGNAVVGKRDHGGPFGLFALMFHRVTVERVMLDVSAVRQRTGLELQLGSAALADVFCPQEHIAVVIDRREALVCDECVTLGSTRKVGDMATVLEVSMGADRRTFYEPKS